MTNEIKNIITKITEEVLGYLGYSQVSSVSSYDNEGSFVVAVDSEDKMGLLIGKNGQNINALEHLVKVLSYKKVLNEGTVHEPINFSLDINNYRKLRADYVIKVAKEIASKVSHTKRSEALLPMNSYERRLIHTELASFADIETESVGEEPRRRIIIKPTAEI